MSHDAPAFLERQHPHPASLNFLELNQEKEEEMGKRKKQMKHPSLFLSRQSASDLIVNQYQALISIAQSIKLCIGPN